MYRLLTSHTRPSRFLPTSEVGEGREYPHSLTLTTRAAYAQETPELPLITRTLLTDPKQERPYVR